MQSALRFRGLVRARRCLRQYSTANPSAQAGFRSKAELVAGGTAGLLVGLFTTWHIADGKRTILLDAKKTSATIGQVPADDHRLPLTTSLSSTGAPPSEGDANSHEELEQSHPENAEDDASGAFNPVTGEINWDCPCLGGMAHGPCGQQFRDAFACFVYSEDEPKGINCVEKFKLMQDCFRQHPDVYAEEIADDEEAEAEAEAVVSEVASGIETDSSQSS